MKLLLDSHAFLWSAFEPERLPEDTRSAVADLGIPVFVSVATVWELNIKIGLGKLAVPDDLVEMVAGLGYRTLPIHLHHAALVRALPPLHRDPFDRMLVAQARAEGLTLVTADHMIRQYEVPVLWS